jgi:hypothetical protein
MVCTVAIRFDAAAQAGSEARPEIDRQGNGRQEERDLLRREKYYETYIRWYRRLWSSALHRIRPGSYAGPVISGSDLAAPATRARCFMPSVVEPALELLKPVIDFTHDALDSGDRGIADSLLGLRAIAKIAVPKTTSAEPIQDFNGRFDARIQFGPNTSTT